MKIYEDGHCQSFIILQNELNYVCTFGGISIRTVIRREDHNQHHNLITRSKRPPTNIYNVSRKSYCFSYAD